MTWERTVTACTLLRVQGIKVFGFTMMFNFWEEDGELHHETPDEVRQTMRDVYGLWWKGLINYTSWSFAIPVQGAELYDIALRHGMIDRNCYPSDTWDIFRFLNGITKREFNSLYAQARRQPAIMAIGSGDFEWRNYRGILRKARTMFFGKPENQTSGISEQERPGRIPRPRRTPEDPSVAVGSAPHHADTLREPQR